MSVLNKFLDSIKMNDDDEFDDDLLDDEFDELDDLDDDFLDDDDVKSGKGFFSRFSKKKEAPEDDFDEDEPVVKTRDKSSKKEKVKEPVREQPKVTSRTASAAPKSSQTFAPKTEKTTRTASSSSKITPMRNSRRNTSPASTAMEVVVIQPKSMEDASGIADTLMDNSTVILNLEGIDVELAQRISDFSIGACYALGGKLKKVSSYIFVLVPYNVAIVADLESFIGESAPSIRAGY